MTEQGEKVQIIACINYLHFQCSLWVSQPYCFNLQQSALDMSTNCSDVIFGRGLNIHLE